MSTLTAEQWNERYPVGTLVTAYPGMRPDRPAAGSDTVTVVTGVTRTRAWHSDVAGCDVVMIRSVSGWIKLSHVDPQ